MVIEAIFIPVIANIIGEYLRDENIIVQVAGFEWCPHKLDVPPLRICVDSLTTIGEVLRKIKLVEQPTLLHVFEYINTVDGRTLARYNPDTPSNVILVMNDAKWPSTLTTPTKGAKYRDSEGFRTSKEIRDTNPLQRTLI